MEGLINKTKISFLTAGGIGLITLAYFMKKHN